MQVHVCQKKCTGIFTTALYVIIKNLKQPVYQQNKLLFIHKCHTHTQSNESEQVTDTHSNFNEFHITLRGRCHQHKEYIAYTSIYIKLKNRENQCLVLQLEEGRTVVGRECKGIS